MLSNWNSGRKGATYNFIDRKISSYFRISGTAAYIHLYIGPYDQSGNPNAPQPSITSIQDVLFLENRDRKYSDNVYELRVLYNVTDVDFDLRQFGLFLQNDTLFLEFHLNDTIAALGRKLMTGDVIELPHTRDDALLDPNAPAVNKFYVVEEVNRSAGGYSPTWFPHLLRAKCSPMTDSQEYADILDKKATDPFGFQTSSTLRDVMSTVGIEMGISEDIVNSAKENVSGWNFETRQFYVVPGDELTGQYPWVFAGDGIPPNGAEVIGSGTSYPNPAQEGDYYLRVDYNPATLFRYTNGHWAFQEQDYRQTDWSAASRVLLSFIRNDATLTLGDGTVVTEKQPLYRAAAPKADF